MSQDISEPFSPKLAATMLYALGKAGDMGVMRLAKVVYLSDYTYAKTFGNLHGYLEGHYRYTYGPIPKQFYPTLRHLYRTEKAVRNDKNIVLKNRSSFLAHIDELELTEQEKACVDKVLEKIKLTSLSEVKAMAYKTEPMVEIQKKESTLYMGMKMLNAPMDFSTIKRHPLFAYEDLDISFMNDPEFQKNLS